MQFIAKAKSRNCLAVHLYKMFIIEHMPLKLNVFSLSLNVTYKLALLKFSKTLKTMIALNLNLKVLSYITHIESF